MTLPRLRVLAGLVAVLPLLTGPAAAARPEVVHKPVYRYYHLARTDSKPHDIRGTSTFTLHHRHGYAFEWVTQTLRGRRDVFDSGFALGGDLAQATAAGQTVSACDVGEACSAEDSTTWRFQVPWPVYFDYFWVTRDVEVSVDLSKSPDKHWVFKELTGEAAGQMHVLMPKDGDVTGAGVSIVTVQNTRDIGYPGGRFGSLATAVVPRNAYYLTGSFGSLVLDGAEKYVQDIDRIDGQRDYASASHRGPTYWRLHGDLTTVGLGAGPTLVVYDLPDPKVLSAFMRRR